jgi:two-component sensor histidine kinase/ligand-binding sensor domain-containing protein
LNRNKKIIPVLLIFAVFALSLSIDAQTVTVTSLSIKNGLSQASVTAFEQDSDGFIWIGTRDGLNRYDGYDFDIIRHELNDSTSLSHNFITDIEEDVNGKLWVGTIFGLNIFDQKSFRSRALYHWFEDSTSISNNNIRCIERDLDGNMWVGTENGLNVLSADGVLIRRYGISRDDPASLSSNRINDISCDSDGNIWVATDGGLNRVERGTNSVTRYLRPFDEFFRPGDNEVITLECCPQGPIWLGTKNGLSIFDPETEKFNSVPINKLVGLPDPIAVQAISKSPKGTCWVGTPVGLLKFNQSGELVEKIISSPQNEPQLRSSDISNIFFDRSGLLWVGTKSSGMAMLSDDLPFFRSMIFPIGEGYSLGANNITAIGAETENTFLIGTQNGFKRVTKNENGQLYMSNKIKGLRELKDLVISSIAQTDSLCWVGTQDSGIAVYDKVEDSFRFYKYNPENSTGLSSNNINELILDSLGNVWVATRGGGLCYVNAGTGLIENFRFEGATPNTLRDNHVSCLEIDSLGNIWVGTANGGLFCLDHDSGDFTPYSTRKDEGGLSSNSINDLYIDSENILWIATSGGGLCELRPGSEKFEIHSSDNGLINDVVLAVKTDGFGHVWLTTNTGISQYDKRKRSFKNYLDFQMAGDNTFNKRALLVDNNGLALFGGGNGLSYLNVANIQTNDYRPQMAITSCQLLGGESPDKLKTKRVFSGDTLKLEYNHSGFEIEFAALNYLNSEKNKYKYRLLGLFERWRPASETRKSTFSNLNPGLYVFEVLGSNNDGAWSETPAQLIIRVNPAFWQTLWFQITAVIIIIGILFLIYRYRISMETIRRHELEKAVELRTSEIAKERDTNAILLQEIHHRVKNNLQIIVSLLSLQSRFITNPALLSTFSEIQNRIRSMSLIHQKMYKTEDLQSVNIEEYIRDLSNNLVSTYRLSNQIDLDVNVEVNNFNSDTLTPLGLIINEVISNALKYAFEEDRTGKITVSLKRLNDSKYEMIIGDDGVGVDENIFEKENESFGTELISALVEQLNGTIELMDSEKGTYYRILFENVS